MREKIALKPFINELAEEMRSLIAERGCTIFSDIHQEIFIKTDRKIFSKILEKIFAGTIRSSYNSQIRISAEEDDGRTFIRITDNNSDYSSYISGKMSKAETLLATIGGKIYFEFNNRHNISIVLCFYQPVIAA